MISFREAKREDLNTIVQMLADDELGKKRESYQTPLPSCYLESFEAIDNDPNNLLIVATEGERVVGTLQLTLIPYLTFKGGKRALIEAVRVHRDFRRKGLGRQLFEWAIQKAKDLDCHLVQLTTNKSRDGAYDFYEALGFEASHEGMKLYLKPW